MASTPRTVEREEERRINSRTLAIASIASATAAAVTSQLWIHGTWIAAAVTPVLVTLLSEALHRPTDRIARRISTGERPRAPSRPPAAPSTPPASPAEPASSGAEPPVRIYRQPSSRAPRRRIALGVVAATAAIAFVIAAVTLTAGELLAGGSLAGGERKTTLGGGSTSERSKDQRESETTGDERTAPAEQETEPTDEPTDTPTPRPAPKEPATTAPAPEEAPTTTPTTPLPGAQGAPTSP
jgi:hypothetical protein